jgi:hypothetical protein
LYSRNGVRPRNADGQRFIHSAVQCEGGEVEGGRRDGARIVVTPWSYLRSGDRTPNMDVSVAMAAPIYDGIKSAIVFVFWNTRIAQITDIAQQRVR